LARGLASRKVCIGVLPNLVVADDPLIEIALQLGDRAIDLLAERHAIELVEDGLVEPLGDAIIWYEIRRRLAVRYSREGNGDLVSPSGTRGAGSTKVRAGRR
jgi:hypothetical protein